MMDEIFWSIRKSLEARPENCWEKRHNALLAKLPTWRI